MCGRFVVVSSPAYFLLRAAECQDDHTTTAKYLNEVDAKATVLHTLVV